MSYHGLGLAIGPSLPGGMTPGQIASTPPPQTANPDTGSFMSFSPTPAPTPPPTQTPGLITRLIGMATLHPGTLLAPKTTPPPQTTPAPTPDQTTPAPTPDQTTDFTQQLAPLASNFPWKTAAAIGAGALVLGVGGWFLLRKKKDVTPNRRRRRR